MPNAKIRGGGGGGGGGVELISKLGKAQSPPPPPPPNTPCFGMCIIYIMSGNFNYRVNQQYIQCYREREQNFSICSPSKNVDDLSTN